MALIAVGMTSVPALSATVGSNCSGSATVFVAPSLSHVANCARAHGCTFGYDVRGGYYAVAHSVDGKKFSVSAAGFRKQMSADQRAIEPCQGWGGIACVVTMKGYDNKANYRNCR